MYTRTTSSSSTSTCRYHVFLSFRGPDTRTTFTDHLYSALTRAGAITFRDEDEIETGEKIKLELERAIKSSKMSIIVFSETYASSKACLQEVETILEYSKRSQHHFLPVFYRIEPANLKDQALKGLPDVDATEERKKRWSMALKEVASIAGMHLKDQHESKFVQQIVEHVTQKINSKVLSISEHLIGLISRVAKINRWLKDDWAISAKILVICGMGGEGKTTAAKYIYNSHFMNFDASTFLENIRETCRLPKGLIGLQRQLLSEILGKEQEKIYTIDSGIRRIERVLGNKKILIVLDDVDDVKQLDAILGRGNWTSGSKIIITTRRKDLLKAIENCFYHKIERLDDQESLELFSMHAFGRKSPSYGFLEHSKKFVRYCQGLPLALEVLGSSLSKTSLDEWVTVLDKLDTIPDKNITGTLKISYDSLESDYDRSLFLDIACFFVGVKKHKVVEILNGCGYGTTLGIQRLVDRNLLTVENGKLGMHQWLQHMGRQIVSNESKFPEGRSRLWRTDECINILKAKTGSANIEGLVVDMNVLKKDNFAPTNSYFQSTSLFSRLSRYLYWGSSNDEALKTDAFTNMHNLRLLKLGYQPISGNYKEFPKCVRWLYWRHIPLRSLPDDFPLENIVYLDLRNSSLEQIWKGTKVLPSLKFLNLSHSPKLTKTPNFSGVPNLEKLFLKDCQNLVVVDESIANLRRLIVLNLKNCKKLRKLPRNIHVIKSLEEVVVFGCSNLVLLEDQREKMESLGVYPCAGSDINQASSNFSEVPPSVPVILWYSLPRSLVSLSLENCNLSNGAFPENFPNLPMLKFLRLGGNPIYSMPNFIKYFRRLQKLELSRCTRLEQISWPSINLGELIVTDCISLEKITCETWVSPQYISHDGCVSLNYVGLGFKIEPLGEVDGDVLDNIGFFDLESKANTEMTIMNILVHSRLKLLVQILYEHGIFSTYFPQKVPHRFSYKSKGSTISFTIPTSSCLEIRGFNLCLVYTCLSNSRDEDYWSEAITVKINNKSKGEEKQYSPRCWAIPEVDGRDLVWLSHWLSLVWGYLFEEGNQVEVSFNLNVEGQIKECGVELLYFNEEGGGKVHYYNTLRSSWDTRMDIFCDMSVADNVEDNQEGRSEEKEDEDDDEVASV